MCVDRRYVFHTLVHATPAVGGSESLFRFLLLAAFTVLVLLINDGTLALLDDESDSFEELPVIGLRQQFKAVNIGLYVVVPILIVKVCVHHVVVSIDSGSHGGFVV